MTSRMSKGTEEPQQKRLRQSSIIECFGSNSERVNRSCQSGASGGIATTCHKMACVKETSSESYRDDVTDSLKCEFSKLRTLPQCAPLLPELKSNNEHTVLFKLNPKFDSPPKPSLESYEDQWDDSHVRMPCSSLNLYPTEEEGRTQLESRWNMIRCSLRGNISTSYGLEEAILSYNLRYSHKWNFKGLHSFFSEVLEPSECKTFFTTTLPQMIRLALQLPYLCSQPIPLLKQCINHTISLSQLQIASLLANAFFCTFPRRNSSGKYSEYFNYPEINFTGLYSSGDKRGVVNRKAEKLKCLLHYFKRVTTEEPLGTVSFKRQYLDSYPEWNNCNDKLGTLHVTPVGCIEDGGVGMLQVDFANKLVGGGVLGWGCVQEEIRFIICPELIVSRLFTEKLNDNETLIITGCEQYCKYEGYANNFKFAGDFEDHTPRDSWGRKYTKVVAMDAKSFRARQLQYKPEWLTRELNKAYCGFYSPGTMQDHLEAVATGNWGCGVYHGDPRLKVLLQLMAATRAGRQMVYFTFRDEELSRDISDFYKFLTANDITIGSLWKILNTYHSRRDRDEDSTLYQHIRSFFNKTDGQVSDNA